MPRAPFSHALHIRTCKPGSHVHDDRRLSSRSSRRHSGPSERKVHTLFSCVASYGTRQGSAHAVVLHWHSRTTLTPSALHHLSLANLQNASVSGNNDESRGVLYHAGTVLVSHHAIPDASGHEQAHSGESESRFSGESQQTDDNPDATTHDGSGKQRVHTSKSVGSSKHGNKKS